MVARMLLPLLNSSVNRSGPLLSKGHVTYLFLGPTIVVLFFVPAHNLRMARALISFLSCDTSAEFGNFSVVVWLARACISRWWLPLP